jgi:very-short-patch-repair endonuclease/predicted transcriptional regulator of viral defense system
VRLARIAARQHGVVGRRQLLAIGISDRGIAGRVSQGRLHRLYLGVYAVGHPRLTQAGRWMAAVVACGHGAVLSHLDAAALWGFFNGIGALIHVTVASHRRVKGLILHRTRRLDPEDVTVNNGIPVTTVERTFVDLTECLSEDRLLRAMREAEFQRLLDLDALNAAVERAHGRRRLKPLKDAIAKHRPGQIIRGELEHRFAELLRGTSIREPDTNVPVEARGRTYVLDCYWPEHRLAVELDGRDGHAREMAFESDRRKDAALNAIGVRLLRFTWQRVAYDGAELLADLTAAMNASNSSWSRS